jgi:hypothetical protein
LRAGDVYDVQVHKIHRFEVIESGVVIEVYFPAYAGEAVSLDDIHRLDNGGVFDRAQALRSA